MTAPSDTLPVLTEDLLSQMRTFGRGNIFAVRVLRDVKSNGHNVIVPKGTTTWASETEPFPGDPDNGSYTLWTAHTHYAGVKSSSMPSTYVERIEGIPEVLL